MDNYLHMALEMYEQGVLSADALSQVAQSAVADLSALAPQFAHQWPRRPMVWHSRCEEYLRCIRAANTALEERSSPHVPIPMEALRRAQMMLELTPARQERQTSTAAPPANTLATASLGRQTVGNPARHSLHEAALSTPATRGAPLTPRRTARVSGLL